MAVTATASLTSSGSLASPKLGDVLDYRVILTGDSEAISISPGQVTATIPGGAEQQVTVLGGPWSLTLLDLDTVAAPVVTGGGLSVPFVQDPADFRHWTATI